MKSSVFAATIISAISAVSTYAAIMPVEGQVTNVTANTTSSISFDAFDTSLGTLIKVTWKAEISSLGGTSTVTAEAGDMNVIVNILNQVTLFGVTGNLNQSTGTIVVPAGVDTQGTLSAANVTTQGSFTDPADLVTFLTGSQVTVALNSVLFPAAQIVGEGSSRTPATSNSVPYNVKLYVDYEYTTVPEAASLSVLSLGAMALLARRRK